VNCPECNSANVVDDTVGNAHCLNCGHIFKPQSLNTTATPSTSGEKMATEPTQPITIKVTEKDRTFILAMSSIVLFAGEIAAGVYVAITHPEANLEMLKEAVLFTGGLISTAWTWYFVKKNGQKKE
jgi:hypothetical protein